MGLDSVELLMEAENYFKVLLPDSEAAKIYTVQNLVDSIALHRGIMAEGTPLRERVFSEFAHCIRTLKKSDIEIAFTDSIISHLDPDDKVLWDELENCLKLQLPGGGYLDIKRDIFSSRLLKLIGDNPGYDRQLITVAQFTDAVCACNYKQLIDADNISNKHEIYIGVVGLAAELLGIDYFEISPESSFTTDLGID